MRSLFPICLLLAVALAIQFGQSAATDSEESDEESSWNQDKRRSLSQAFGKRRSLSQAFGKRGSLSQAFGKRGLFSQAYGKRPKPFSQAFGKRRIGSLSQGFGKRDGHDTDVYVDY
uniref:Uncharacterized protein n=1 Tax=Plectus sambesii TaxID=2011161 RepID=A0A914UYI5_9BILA